MADSAHSDGRDAGAWTLLALPALLPFGAAAELPVLLGAVWGLVWAVRGRMDRHAPMLRLATILFLAYWLPELVSAPDSAAPRKSWAEVALDLRFLPFLWFALRVLDTPQRTQRVALGVAVLVAFWCIDALLQAATGWSLGGASRGDRLSGIFGDDNLKLGGVLAALAPIAVAQAWRGGALAAVAAFLVLLTVVLLAGARAGWVVLAVGLALLLRHRIGTRRALQAGSVAVLLAIVASSLAYHRSERFAQRVDRTAAALRGSEHDLDYALAWRLPIWRTAVALGAAHPVNGVGVRAFRYVYPQYAAVDDRWVAPDRSIGALHAHHWLLEVWSETGAFGLACWLGALAAAWRAWARAGPAARAAAAAPGCALVAVLFPLNTHYAVYSAFWSLLLLLLLALWLGALQARAPAAAPQA